MKKKEKKLVKIVWDAENDMYAVYMHGQPLVYVPISYLEELEEEIKRVFAEVSA